MTRASKACAALALLFVWGGIRSAPLRAAPSEKDFRHDLAYYRRTAKVQGMDANGRLYILNRIRDKYKEAEFDLTDLYAEIDRWTDAKEKEAPSASRAAPKAPAAGRLAGVLVTVGKEETRLRLDVPGLGEYKDSLERDPQGLQPPVLVIYLYDTRERLRSSSRDFSLQRGAIRRVLSQSVSANPPAAKVSISLREDLPYRVERKGGKIVVAISKAAAAEENAPAPGAGLAAPTMLTPAESTSSEKEPDSLEAPATAQAAQESSGAAKAAPAKESLPIPIPPGAVVTGDILKVLVSPDATFSQSAAVVQPDGTASLPGAGSFDAAGRTPAQLEKDLEKKLVQFMSKPRAKVSLVPLEPGQVFVAGEVKSPDAYPYVPSLSCFALISKTGGFMEDADKKNVIIYRGPRGAKKRLVFNAEEFVSSGDPGFDAPLATGDVVEVRPALRRVFLSGAVKSPGRYELKEGMRLMQALYLAGGFTDRARQEQVRLIRQDQGRKLSQEIDVKRLLAGHSELDVPLQDGDTIVVPERKHLKGKLLNKTSVSWFAFIASLGVILALVA